MAAPYAVESCHLTDAKPSRDRQGVHRATVAGGLQPRGCRPTQDTPERGPLLPFSQNGVFQELEIVEVERAEEEVLAKPSSRLLLKPTTGLDSVSTRSNQGS